MKIGHKLSLMAAAIFLAMGVLAYASYNMMQQSAYINAELQRKSKQVNLLSMIENNTNQILLGAMDAIVDKDSGEVDSSLIEEVKRGNETINNSLTLLGSENGGMSEASQIFQDISGKSNALANQHVLQGLFPAIKARMPASEFSKMDDEIDAIGTQIKTQVSKLREDSNASFEALQAKSKEDLNHIIQISILTFVIILLGSMAGVYWLCRSLTTPIGRLRGAIQSISEGEVEIQIPGLKNQDELGDISRALEKLRTQVADAFRLKQMVDDMPLNIIVADPHNDFRINYANQSTIKTLSGLQNLLPVQASGLIGQSIDIFHKDPGRIRTLLQDPANLPHEAKIHLGSEVLDLKVSAMRNHRGKYIGCMLSWMVVTQNAKLADRFEGSVGSVSSQITSSASSLQQSALSLHGAIEELSSSALDISRRAQESAGTVQAASQKGNMAQDSMLRLSEAANKVSSVVDLIKQISSQTNLLALNATIEAARSGEAGKGFAVVANEVKLLATQTANAITDINQQIEEMHQSANEAAVIVKEMCQTIDDVNRFTTEVAATVEEQQAATAEIARNVGSIHSANDNKSDTSIVSQASQLSGVSEHLASECKQFVEQVRAM